MTADDLVERELMFNQFRRLILEVIRGETKRTAFQPWEIDLLIDIEGCALPPRRRVGVLRKYLAAVQRQLERQPGPPMRLSQFLESKKRPPRPRDQ